MRTASIEQYEFQDLFHMEEIQKLTDSISMALEIGIVIVSPDGNPITKPSNFCPFCLNVIRQTEQGRQNCIKSDVVLGRKADGPIISKCLSAGLTDAGVSITIHGKHLASWMLGQVIVEGNELTLEEQKERAKMLGIDETLFIESMKKIPRKSKEQFQRIVEMVQVLAMQLSELGLKSYLQKEEIARREALEEELQKEKARLEFFNKYDDLTKVFSRSYFEEKLDEMNCPEKYPIVIISGDMNNLKMANDVFGHQHGDMMLRYLGNIFLEEAEPSYLIGRCGGDEFCVAIPNGSREEAESYCRRVQQRCQEIQECMIPPTVALGISVKESGEEEIDKAVKRAEDAMYNAKMMKKKTQNIHSDIMDVLFYKEYLSPDVVSASVERIERFGRYLHLEQHTIEILKLCAQIQDVGLIAVPEKIVKKVEQRTQEERMEMSKHTEIGYRLARLYDESFPAADTILQSHECWNGLGYPNHLMGEDILYTARILYMVGTYSCWIYPRPTGSGMEKRAGRERLEGQIGQQFDPILCRQFLNYLEEQEPIA